MTLTFAAFARFDWLVLIGYLVLIFGTGIWSSLRARQRIKTSADYFLGGRSMPAWAVAISILATAQSAATFIGAPDQSFKGNLTYLISNIGGILGGIVLAFCFIPRYYALGVSTPYQMLEHRFGSGAKQAASWTYLIGRIFSSGSRIFIGSLPAAMVIFNDKDASHSHIVIAVLVMTVIGILYTLAGGISSVIWTDVLQAFVYLGTAVGAIVFLLYHIDAPIWTIVSELAKTDVNGESKLTLVRTGVDLSGGVPMIDLTSDFTLLTAVTGALLLTLAAYGMDQDLVQRMLTCKSARKGAWSVIWGVLMGIPAVSIFLIIGLLLFVYYTRSDLTGAAHTLSGNNKVFLQFILDGVPSGLAGLMMAGLFAAGLSSVNSTLNSMSSAFVADIYKPRFKDRSEEHYLRVGRLGVVVAGILLGAFAVICVYWFGSTGSTLLSFALSVMNFAYAGLLGVFFTALFTRRGNTYSAIAALAGGFSVILLLESRVWDWIVYGTLGGESQLARLAFPWKLCIGASASFVICWLGTPIPDRAASKTA